MKSTSSGPKSGFKSAPRAYSGSRSASSSRSDSPRRSDKPYEKRDAGDRPARRPFRTDKAEGGYEGRSERPARAGRPSAERSERSFGERPARRPFRTDKAEGGYEGRSERPTGERSERSFGERPARRPFRTDKAEGGYEGRSERPARAGRPSGERSERSFGDRPARRPFRTDKAEGGYEGRSERPARAGRPSAERSERSFGDRPARGGRSDRFEDKFAPRSFKDDPESLGKKTPRYAAKKKFAKKPTKGGDAGDKKRYKPKNNEALTETAENTAPKPRTFARKGVLLWGIHAVHAALLNPERDCFQIWTTEAGTTALEAIMEKAKAADITLPVPNLVERAAFDNLLPPNSIHQGIAAEFAPLAEKQLFQILQQEDKPQLIVVLDQVTDPHNVGAIMRSSAAFGAGALVVTDRHSPEMTGVMAKTACGAVECIPQIQVVNLSRALVELKEAGYWCVGLAEEAEGDLSSLDLTGQVAIILGAEGDGLRRLTREHCDHLARLPTGGPIGSINVSNAAAISLYEVKRQVLVKK